MRAEVRIDEAAALAATVSRLVEETAPAALAARGRFAIALPGGSVAQAFLPVLARAMVDWKRVDFFWGDERAVPADHPDSNYGLARALWLGDAGIPGERIHRMEADPGAEELADQQAATRLDAAARAYEAELCEWLGMPPALDVALLGVGPDGHVCSLFPDHPLLDEKDRFVAAVTDSPKPPPRRITLTLPALAAARLLVVAAFGAAKAKVVREALEDPASRLPVALALRQARQALVLLDPAAAGR
jgi:6-phosphogluconolactonase